MLIKRIIIHTAVRMGDPPSAPTVPKANSHLMMTRQKEGLEKTFQGKKHGGMSLEDDISINLLGKEHAPSFRNRIEPPWYTVVLDTPFLSIFLCLDISERHANFGAPIKLKFSFPCLRLCLCFRQCLSNILSFGIPSTESL